MNLIKRLLLLTAILIFTQFSIAEALDVYVMNSGNSTNNTLISDLLTGAGYSVTIGQPWYEFNSSLSGYEAVVLLNNYNWNYGGDMPASGQNAILNFVSNGGGLVTGEWFIWSLGTGIFSSLEVLSPVVATTAFSYPSPTTYTQVIPDPILNDGVASPFTFTGDSISGIETYFTAKSDATVYYSSSPYSPGGLIGWDYGDGRVISFSTVIGNTDLGDVNYGNLFVNSVEWASGTPIPEPATMLLLGSGLLGVAGLRRKFKK